MQHRTFTTMDACTSRWGATRRLPAPPPGAYDLQDPPLEVRCRSTLGRTTLPMSRQYERRPLSKLSSVRALISNARCSLYHFVEDGVDALVHCPDTPFLLASVRFGPFLLVASRLYLEVSYQMFGNLSMGRFDPLYRSMGRYCISARVVLCDVATSFVPHPQNKIALSCIRLFLSAARQKPPGLLLCIVFLGG